MRSKSSAADSAGHRSTVLRAVLALVLVAMLASCSSDDGSNADGPVREAETTTAGPSETAPEETDGETDGADGADGDGESGPRPSAGCGVEPVAEPGDVDTTISSGGEDRHYLLTIPEAHDGTTPLPLVLTPHSLTIDYHIVPGMAGLEPLAEEHDFISVSPSGRLGMADAPYWDASPVEDNDDLAFIVDLLDHLEDTLCVDTARIHSIGMSNGAQMSSMFGCRIGDRIAGIAPIAGVEYNEPCEGPPVPIFAFHGTEDPTVPYDGGGLNSVTIADINLYHGAMPEGTFQPTGVDESMDRWAEHNGCDPERIEDEIAPGIVLRTWDGCEAPTSLYIIEGGGHTWPGDAMAGMGDAFGAGTDEIDATEIFFDFIFADEA